MIGPPPAALGAAATGHARGEGRRLGAVAEAQLLEHVADMGLDGRLAEEPGARRSRGCAGPRPAARALPARAARGPRVAPSEPRSTSLRTRPAIEGAIRGSPAPAPSTAAGELGGRHVLDQVPGRADAQRGPAGRAPARRPSGSARGRRRARPDRRTHLDAAQLGHPQVEHQHVRVQLRSASASASRPSAARPTTSMRGSSRQQRGGPLSHEAVVVGDDDAHTLGAHCDRSMVIAAHG